MKQDTVTLEPRYKVLASVIVRTRSYKSSRDHIADISPQQSGGIGRVTGLCWPPLAHHKFDGHYLLALHDVLTMVDLDLHVIVIHTVLHSECFSAVLGSLQFSSALSIN